MSEGIGDSGTPGQVWYSPLPSIRGQALDANVHVFTFEHFKSWRVFLASRRKRVLILGVGTLAEDLEDCLRRRPDHSYDIVGYANDSPHRARGTLDGKKFLGTYEELLSLVEEQGITTIAVCIKNQRGVLPFNALLNLKARGIEIVDGLLLQERVQGRIPLSHLKPSHLIFSATRFRTRLFHIVKRVLDVLGAFSALAFLAPLFAIFASLITVGTRRSPFIWTFRIGRYGRRFSQSQFRVSALVGDSEQPLPLSIRRRFFRRVGIFMTTYSFDRLPQLINILLGDMSFVGPRPEHVQSASELDKTIPFYSMRRSVRPGMTGWSQIESIAVLTSRIHEYELPYDLYYVRNQSFSLDLRILFKTIRMSFLNIR